MTPTATADRHDQTLEHFRVHGWMRVRQAFSAEAAARMREVVWAGLEPSGVRRDRPSTWTVERPVQLQHLKSHPAFEAVGGERLLAAASAILETSAYQRPKTWGALFIAFPSDGEWEVPSSGWHADANYRSQLSPPKGVQIHSLFGDVPPRGGGSLILSGSHRLIHGWFQQNPPPPEARSADLRRLLLAHPYMRDLHTAGDPAGRIARFMERTEEVDGVPLRVVENCGAAGDVMLLHPLLMHVAARNSGTAPRFLLSGSITTDMSGWG